MQNICYLIAIIIGAFLGYQDVEWYFLFIAGAVGSVGYLAERPGLINNIRKKNGEIGYFGFFAMQVVVSSILPAIAYLIARQFN